MAGRLAVDFGTSNTVLAVWDEQRKEGVPLVIPEFSHIYRQGDDEVAVVPSLINYAADNRRWIGNQVLQRRAVPFSPDLPLDEALYQPAQSDQGKNQWA